ncbi:hypothetical protein LEP1GSC193_0136 [Leptospira alstonii serovar Pingchang str. 80-412]|uniref:Uncharacterized protein n=1 Tax=Leptospira alstonii serovar Pingchang str. 80-412 TaxID=1218564 RepID=T0G7M2_9LEPT|nr:hypothetical protein LEP1GSC193_0136 [Leptospira alstonii serovar Pingchang str. 80-412]
MQVKSSILVGTLAFYLVETYYVLVTKEEIFAEMPPMLSDKNLQNILFF